MKYEDYEKIAKGLTTENAPDIVGQLLENIKADTASIEALTKSNEEKELKIRDLQDTNIKLFLSQTGKADDDSPDAEQLAKEQHEAVENEISNILKGE
jgi:hypothetical protein